MSNANGFPFREGTTTIEGDEPRLELDLWVEEV